MSEKQQPQTSTKLKGIRKFGFILSMILVASGLLGNITQLLDITQEHLPNNMIPWFASTIVLCIALIIGLLALLAED